MPPLNGTRKGYFWSEPRSFNIFNLTIPPLGGSQPITSLQFAVDSETSVQGAMQLYYAVSSDEFATSMDTTSQVGLVTDSGKVMKLSFDPAVNGPLYDACSGGCILYVAVRARQPMRSFVTATLLYKD